MDSAFPLATLLRSHLARPDAAPESALEAQLGEVVREARARWATVALADEVFVPYLAARIPADEAITTALARMHATDVYLACACARGDAAALRAFEAEYQPEIARALARSPNLPGADLKQMIWEKLFVGADGRPRIAEYAGGGELRSWLRVVIARTIINAATRGPRETPVEDSLLMAMQLPAEDPEIGHLKRIYRTEYEAAFGEAVRSLSSRQRNLLRHAVVDSRSIDHIARVYRIHRATAARWLTKAREDLVANVRNALRARLKIDAQELQSILRLLESQLHVSLERLLGR